MGQIWGKIGKSLSIAIIYGLLGSRSKAIASLEIQSTHLNLVQQNKTTSSIIERQVNFGSQTGEIFLAQNSIRELQDIQPTDWAYEALKSLIERYRCISGYGDKPVLKDTAESYGLASQTHNGIGSLRTFRGEQTISRAEFVAGLNSCLNKIEEILTTSDLMPQTDVDTVLRLMQEFQSDLAILQGRTDGIQARIGDLETIQFSTTTKLAGEAIIGLGSILSEDDDTKTIFGSRLRLELSTSFSGNDLLFTRLSRNDLAGFGEEIDTFQGNLAFTDSDATSLSLDSLLYSFGVGDNVDFIVGATGTSADDIAKTINFLDGDGATGAISAFGSRNPIYNPPGDAGIGVVHRPIKQIEISAGYLASPTNESSPGNGLFNGAYSALGQITVSPWESLSLAATYVHSFNQSDTATGTDLANLRSETEELFSESIPTVSNSYGLELSWAISDRLVIGGWGGLSKVSNLSTIEQDLDRGTQDIWNWAATLAFPDLGKEGSLVGIVVGSEPTVTNSSINNLEVDRDRSLHLEAFYQYQINDNVAITPGVIWITEPDTSIEDANDLVIGTVRTTFSF